MDQMARKLEKSKRIEEEHRRKSPRMSAGLDGGAWKAHRSTHVTLTRATTCPLKMATDSIGQSQGQGQGPASRTRSRKKRKLRPVNQVLSPKQGGEESKRDNRQANIEQRFVQGKNGTKHEKQGLCSTERSKPEIPEKRVLELVLDVLQRRDIQEIFAEPVDPEEVEDYYEIIKEPMDFGTMRAKLHEGMYTSLGQFEHDIFLITKNAMHFNSSTTIYFRQARVINELAVKVFDVLKTRPESFESEFLESRRRNGRRPQVEARNSLNRTRPKMARNVKSSKTLIDEPSKSTPSSLSAASNIRRRAAVRHGHSGSVPFSDARDNKVSCGQSDDGGSTEVDRRSTYQPLTLNLHEEESIVSTLSGTKNQLERVIQQDIGYRESLMRFVKDLGPVVQMIAKHKLLESLPSQYSRSPVTCKNNCQETSTPGNAITAPISQNFVDQVHGHSTFTTNAARRVDFKIADNREKNLIDEKMEQVSAKLGDERKIVQSATWWDNRNRSDDQNSNTKSCLFSVARAGELSSFSFAGLKNTGNKSTPPVDQEDSDNAARSSGLGFAHCYLNLREPKLRNVDGSSFGRSEASTSKLSSECLTQCDQVKARQGLIHEAGPAVTLDRCKPWTSQFKCEPASSSEARFVPINAFRERTFLQQSLSTAVNFFHI